MSEDEGMVIGVDLGSHHSSIAIWSMGKDSIDVLADDTGSRVMPTTVAFRGDEILTGQSAVTQQHKNGPNTFEDIRSLLFNSSASDQTISVPALDREIAISELLTHFFRNIHNQVKQQVGSIIRDCILSIPPLEDEGMKARLITAAQAGGIRIKSVIDDSAAILLSYSMDDVNVVNSRVLVLDVGWTKSSIDIYSIRGGVFYRVGGAVTNEAGGGIMVSALADHFAKDFMRKAKFPCADNKKAMIRLKRECEGAVKSLSTGAEATITVDSLCEGVDYSSRISRARFEDLCSIPFMKLKTKLTEVLTEHNLTPEDIEFVCMGGGSAAVPKVISTVKSIFVNATFPKLPRLETAETICFGAAKHGRNLRSSGLLDELQKVTIPDLLCTDMCLALSVSDSGPYNTLVPSKVPLPYETNVFLSTVHSQAYFQIVGFDNFEDQTSPKKIGDVFFPVEGAAENDPIVLRLNVVCDVTLNVNICIFVGDSVEPAKTITINA